MKTHKVVNLKELRSGNVLPPLTTTEEEMCNDHNGEKKKFYCETCETPICRDCIVLDHRQHKYISLKEASKNNVAKLREFAIKCEKLQEKNMENVTEQLE